MNKAFYATYNENNIRSVAIRMAAKYNGLDKQHVYWLAKQLDIYPDGVAHKNSKAISESKTGKINRNNLKYVTGGKLNETGIQAIENILMEEGYTVKSDFTEEKMEVKMAENTNIWEQADLISLMKRDYEKAVEELNRVKEEAESYCQLADKYEKENEELKDKLLISEKENNDLKSEKKDLSKMQIDGVKFDKEIDILQKRIGKYNQDINMYSSEVNELRKDLAAFQASMSRLQDNKKKLEAVMSDLIVCSKRLINMK